ncbi:MAG TPA: molybdopterin cofactor-binding domain-containing protein [Burkholderiales bacterium]|nr:molybdopterin cofactor-binding domain-containing protein [Burkholderiales bacterium]
MRMNRRSFIVSSAAVTGGLALGFRLPFGGPDVARAQDGSPEIGVWVAIGPDDTVNIRVVRSEMGQGTITGLAQLVADELECNWSKVKIEYPTPGESVKRKRAWGDFSTGGSRGIRESHEYVRKGGAAARMMLVQAAADQWKVPVADCSAANSVITHGPTKRKLRYGQVAERAAKLPVPQDVKLKDPKEWKLIGKPIKRLDTADKVVGKTVYGIDIKQPGLLNAAIKDCPVFGGKVKSFDASKVESMRGVKKVVQVGDSAVAVVADTWWRAKTALDALPIVWDEGENAKVSSATIAEVLKAGLDAEQAFVGNQNGNAKEALAGAAKKVEAVYAYPFQNHACMEPMNITVRYTPEKCEAWGPTQNGEGAFAAMLAASGLPADKVDVYKTMLGGGFGRRGAYPDDYVTQAVLIAKQMPGTPIKLLWSREEDMAHGRYHPVMQCKLVGGLDASGNLTGLHMRLSGQSILAAVRPEVVQAQKGRDPLSFQGVFESGEHQFSYSVPNLLIDHAMRNTHVPPGFWRGVNINQNAIFIECFMDELADAAGQDALEFRRKLLAKNPRGLAVLNAAAEKLGWGKPAPSGRYRGLAVLKAFNSYVAGAAEISVTDGNKVKVHRLVGATDPGYAVNPAQIERQVAGSFVYGLSGAFMQECTVRDGRIEQTNFHEYNSMRIAQMPKVETVLLQGGGPIWGGIGEPTICVAAPAVMNAFYRATGKRLRSVPLKNHGVELV